MTRRKAGAFILVAVAAFAVSKGVLRSATAAESDRVRALLEARQEGVRAALAASQDQVKEEILKVDEERNQALQHGDVATLDRIYADDLVYANATGALLTKSQHLADLKGRSLNFKSFKHDDVQVTVHGDTGILTGISTSAVEFHGTVSSSPRRFLNVFVKKDGRWLCAAHFETPVVSK